MIELRTGDWEELILECTVTGHPLPEVMWVKDEVVLIPYASTIQTIGRYKAIIHHDGKCRFSVQHPREPDAGLYKVMARNSSWLAESTLDVVIRNRRKCLKNSIE